jgi:hypothetical protein
MANTIKAGSILIDEGIFLPESLLFESEYCAQGWILVKNLNSYGMKQIVSKAGWSFLYMTGEVKSRIFGSDEEKIRRKAIEQVLAKMRSKKVNCLEITRIAAKRFLGLPYVSVQARPRQIQESPGLFEEFFGDQTKSQEIGANSPQIDTYATDIHRLNPCLIRRIHVDPW